MPKRLHNDDESKDLSHLFKMDIQTPDRTLKFSELCKNMDPKQTWIPSQWPPILPQKGPNCAVYALHAGLKNGFKEAADGSPIPPPRKDGRKDIISIREVLKDSKKKPYTSFGEVFNREAFIYLTDYFEFPGCKMIHIAKKDETEEKYTKAILKKLSEAYSIIVSCDLGENNFPDSNKGLHTHWALIYGAYYTLDKKLEFLVAQYGKYYSWSAADLFKSNLGLPHKNPKIKPHYAYYKTNDLGMKFEYFFKVNNEKKLIGKKIKYVLGDTLEQFRFSLFSIPSPPLKECLSPEDITQKTSFKLIKKK